MAIRYQLFRTFIPEQEQLHLLDMEIFHLRMRSIGQVIIKSVYIVEITFALKGKVFHETVGTIFI